MYRGGTRIGDVLSPFKRDSTIQNAIASAQKQIEQRITEEDPMASDSYFRMATELPYMKKNGPRLPTISGADSRVDLSSTDNIAWVDMEMSGLDLNKHQILEVAMVITDGNLNLVAEHETVTVNHDEQVINDFNDWCKKQHGESGLTERVRQSTKSLRNVESELVQFAKRFCAPNGKTCLAGNTVYMDKLFLEKHMPLLNSCFHYRVIDVSSVSELCKRWRNDIYRSKPAKLTTHRYVIVVILTCYRARMDIYESIRELMYYRKHFFKK
jgi:oligoribonuclease